MYDYKNIRVELPEPGIAVMSFARPEKLNSWSRGAFEDLLDFFRRLKTDDDLKVVVLRGDGDRAFCTGADFVSLFPGEGERESLQSPTPSRRRCASSSSSYTRRGRSSSPPSTATPSAGAFS